MRFTHKQINKDTLNMRLAAAANKMVNKRAMAQDLSSSIKYYLELKGHVATGRLYQSVKASAPKRKFMKQMNSATNTYTIPYQMLDYGIKLNDGFTVTGKPYSLHYEAIRKWAEAKRDVPSTIEFISNTVGVHIRGKMIGKTNWLGYKDGADDSAIGRFINSPKTYMPDEQLAEVAADRFWQELDRVFPKQIGITK